MNPRTGSAVAAYANRAAKDKAAAGSINRAAARGGVSSAVTKEIAVAYDCA